MDKKTFLLISILFLAFTCAVQPAYATGKKEGAASLILPTYGQAMNNETYKTKTKFMAGIEIAAITTSVVLGTTVGGPVVWAGLGPLIANHLWSSIDAYKGAQVKKDPGIEEQLRSAQRSLELSRQRRYNTQAAYQSDLRDRIRLAGEQAR
ncbi:MAG: hypothetical protein WC352_05565 [Candidatus Omnitrophota bacterium]|jgi:hypothetical protein